MQQSLLRKNKLVSRSVQSPANDSTRMSIHREVNNETPVEKLFNSMMKNSGKRVVIQCTNCAKLRQILANQNEIIQKLQVRMKTIQSGSKVSSPLPTQKKDYFKRQHLELLSSINQSVKRDTEENRQNHHHRTRDQVSEKILESFVKQQIPKSSILYQSLQPQNRLDRRTDYALNQYMSINDQQKSKSLDLKNSESCEYSQDSLQNEDITPQRQGKPKLTLKSINMIQYTHQRQTRTKPEKSRKTWTQILNTRNQSNSPLSILNAESKLDTINNSDFTLYSNESNDYDRSKNVQKKVQLIAPEKRNNSQQKKENISSVFAGKTQSSQDWNLCLQMIRQRTQEILKKYQKTHAQWQEKEKHYVSQISKLHSLLLKKSK